MRAIGLDLTDPYSAQPRDIDVAVVDSSGRCDFAVLPAFSARIPVGSWLSPVSRGPKSGDVLVIDGPLGLASSGSAMRECERILGTPGQTPDSLPIAGSRPFAGYLRGSVELARALLSDGWVPATSTTPATSASMLEAFPGGTWKLLAGRRLPPKTTAAGMNARAALLSQNGLTFSRPPRTHDELDAALCAWLGWQLSHAPSRVTLVGRPSVVVSGQLVEGAILQVAGASLAPSDVAALPHKPRPHRPEAAARKLAIQLPHGVRADWVYYATPSRADRWETAELALDEGVICRPAHNSRGALIANVGNIQPGDVVLLAYASGRGQCEAIGTFVVGQPTIPVAGANAVQIVREPGLQARLAANYPIDSAVGAHTVFLLEVVWTPEPGAPVLVPRLGRNAIWPI